MKKTLLSASVLLSFSSYGTAIEPVNYYVITEQAAPFQIENNNLHQGIISDIVTAVFQDSHYQIRYHSYPFNRMITLLEAGGEPNWITYGSPQWGGVQANNLSEDSVYNVKHVLVSSSKQPFTFKSISDLEDKVVVLLHGFDYPQLVPFIEKGHIEELRVKDYGAAFRVINKLPADTAFIEMESRVKYNLDRQHKNRNDFSIQSFDAIIPSYPIHLAFDPNMDDDLQHFINKRIVELKSSGDIDKIIDKYL
ncbi:substrate-binding periplasmic protein [Photobacterium nomapromontoriensis]|uniref:substrate-binding periplasmic protein n=1 Tax=Photobacterium nomapromontoriensis TaxID=2910237 RepID=UPI003D0D6F23